MTLSALIRKRENATATVATPATHKGAKAGTVANVASVAVANSLLAEEVKAILSWLAHIGEHDQETIEQVLDICRTNSKARERCLKDAASIPSITAKPKQANIQCGECLHFNRVNHPHLGICDRGVRGTAAGLWDNRSRYCELYEEVLNE